MNIMEAMAIALEVRNSQLITYQHVLTRVQPRSLRRMEEKAGSPEPMFMILPIPLAHYAS